MPARQFFTGGGWAHAGEHEGDVDALAVHADLEAAPVEHELDDAVDLQKHGERVCDRNFRVF